MRKNARGETRVEEEKLSKWREKNRRTRARRKQNETKQTNGTDLNLTFVQCSVNGTERTVGEGRRNVARMRSRGLRRALRRDRSG